MSNRKTYSSEYWVEGKRKDVTADNMSVALKFAANALNYPYFKDIPVQGVDTCSLRAGGANELLIAGYSDRYIQKWGDGEGKPLSSIYKKSHIFLQRAF